MKVSITILAAAAGLLIAGSESAKAIDFDCATATGRTERAICASRQLAGLDERMAQAYGLVWGRQANDADRRELRDEQRDFLSRRNDCGADQGCIADAYRRRIGELDRQLYRARRS